MENKDDVVFCKSFSSDVEAHIAQSILEENGIKSIIDNQIFSSVLPIGFNTIGGLRLMVSKKNLDEAKKLLEKI